MSLEPMPGIIGPAVAERRGVGAFNVVTLEHAEALAAAAEAARAPVVLQVSENTVAHHGALEPLGVATLAVARAAAVPVAVHLDHATRADLVHEAVALGFSSVMFDASRLPYADNVRATAEVARYCHERGVFVEAELGEVGGKDGVHAPGARTDPDEARAFVAGTGVDALAVAVGTSHAMRTRDAVVDLDLVRTLRSALGVPLVLHGSSGVPDDDLARAVAAGMTKVNLATALSVEFTAAVRAHLDGHADLVDPRPYLSAGREAMCREAARLLRLLHVIGAPTHDRAPVR